MNVQNLRALTLTGKTYTFSIKDVPVLIDEDDTFILMRRENSPILRFNTITSLTDISSIGVGTVLTDATRTYVVSFKRGFAAVDSEHNVYKLNTLHDYTIDNTDTYNTGCYNQRLLFKYDDLQFQIKDIVGMIHNYAIVKRNHTLVDMSLVQQYAGITYENNKVFFGDIINDGVVTLYQGRVCIRCGSTYYDMTDNQVIERT